MQPGRDRLVLVARFAVDPAAVSPAMQDLSVVLRDGTTTLYDRTLAPGTLQASASGNAFRYRDPASAVQGRIASLSLRRKASDPRQHTLRMAVTGLDLAHVDAGLALLVETLRFGPTRVEGSLASLVNAAGTAATCKR